MTCLRFLDMLEEFVLRSGLEKAGLAFEQVTG